MELRKKSVTSDMAQEQKTIIIVTPAMPLIVQTGAYLDVFSLCTFHRAPNDRDPNYRKYGRAHVEKMTQNPRTRKRDHLNTCEKSNFLKKNIPLRKMANFYVILTEKKIYIYIQTQSALVIARQVLLRSVEEKNKILCQNNLFYFVVRLFY